MHREVIADLKVVYYRGRYWAATAWSKVGKPTASVNPLKMETHGDSKQEVIKPRRKAGSSLEPAA